MEPERDGRDRGERSERTDGDLGKIEPRDIFHDLPAAPHARAVGANERDPDDEIARRAEARATRTETAGRDRAADRRAFRLRDVEHEALTARTDDRVERGERRAGFDFDHHVGRRVIDRSIETRGRDDPIDAFRRIPEPRFRSAARDDEREPALGGVRERRRHVVERCGRQRFGRGEGLSHGRPSRRVRATSARRRRDGRRRAAASGRPCWD